MWKILLICLVTLLIGINCQPGYSATLVKNIKIEGNYSNQTFIGEVTFEFDSINEDIIFFHLPPNWFSEADRREWYHFQNEHLDKHDVARKELKKLRKHTHQNIHLPEGITIQGVFANDQSISFELLNNEDIQPGYYSKNTLLKIPIENRQHLFKVKIKFTTQMQELPSGSKSILWDFAPRFVNYIKSRWDYKDQWRQHYNYDFSITSSTGEDQTNLTTHKFQEIQSIPVLLLDEWSTYNSTYLLSASEYFNGQIPFLQSVIEEPIKFLLDNNWLIRPDQPFKFIIWDGPLASSGKTILLPEKLFRYQFLFGKKMEIETLKGVFNVQLMQNFNISRQNQIWMLPALQSTVIHSYFKHAYEGNTFLFPWDNWLNPDFIQENSVKPWLYNSKNKIMIPATSSRDYIYFSHNYHPWYEKGFHLLPLFQSSEQGYEIEIEPAVKSFLKGETLKQKLLTPETLFSAFTVDSNKKSIVAKWLLENGSIDYGIENVDAKKTAFGSNVIIEINSFGTITPVFEIELTDTDGVKERHWLTNGAGIYQLSSTLLPIQIVLDPDFLLLENNILNNSWSIPLKIRPLWDFSPANQWLFTVSPRIGGNAFNRNMLGLNFTLRYLNQTAMVLNAWKNENEDETLFEGRFLQKNFPWKNATIAVTRSQLNATTASTLNIRHDFINVDEESWLGIEYSQEEYDELDEDREYNTPNRWRLAKLGTEFPLLEGNFTQWKTALSTSQGYKEDEPYLNFQQQSYEQQFTYFFPESDLHLNIKNDYSKGTVPLQKKYPMGGPEGMPGFPRELELFYFQRDIVELGTQLPPFLTHSKLNFVNILWLERIEPTLNFHWGAGHIENESKADIYRDVELRFRFFGEFIHMYEGHIDLAIAQPIGHEKYKDYRVIAFSTWVF